MNNLRFVFKNGNWSHDMPTRIYCNVGAPIPWRYWQSRALHMWFMGYVSIKRDILQ